MQSATIPWLPLSAHPGTKSRAALTIDSTMQLQGPGARIQFLLKGDVSRLNIPPEITPQRADGLWQHTCFEAFLRTPGSPGYLEINIAPSRQWSLYRFDSYRHGMSSPDLPPPQISVRRQGDSLGVDAVFEFRHLLAQSDAAPLHVALSAVIEEDDGRLSYWALKHAPEKPDFHFPGGFVLELGT
jgi:hypothetical protein